MLTKWFLKSSGKAMRWARLCNEPPRLKQGSLTWHGGRLVAAGLNTQMAPSTHAHGALFLCFFSHLTQAPVAGSTPPPG